MNIDDHGRSVAGDGLFYAFSQKGVDGKINPDEASFGYAISIVINRFASQFFTDAR